MQRSVSPIIALFACVLFITPGVHAQVIPDTIYPGELRLPLPFLGTDTVDSYKLAGEERTPTNTWIRKVSPEKEGPRPVLRITTRHVAAFSRDTTTNVLILDPRDLSLIRQEVRARTDSGKVVCDSANHITGWNKLPQRDMMIVDKQYNRRVFPDDGIGPWLIGMLPLRRGYTAVVPQFNLWTGEERFLTLAVVADEELTNGDVRIPCWVVEVYGGQGPPGYMQRRWISKSSRRILKTTAAKSPDDPVHVSELRHWF